MRFINLNFVSNVYHKIAVILFDVIMVFILGEVLLQGAFAFKDWLFPSAGYLPELSGKFTPSGAPVPNGKRIPYVIEMFDYHAMESALSLEETGEMLDEFYDSLFIKKKYEMWGLISSGVFRGRHLNLLKDEKGFHYRETPFIDQKAPGKKIYIYAFGASSTLGINTSDKHTWPNYLEEILNQKAKSQNLNVSVEVRNYGRAAFFSQRESIFFQALIYSGHRPSLVLFMDGANEHNNASLDLTQWGGQMQNYVNKMQESSWDFSGVREMAYFRLLSKFQKGPDKKDLFQPPRAVTSVENKKVNVDNYPFLKEQTQRMLDRYRQTRIIVDNIAKKYAIQTRFFLQPDPVYNYDRSLYRKVPPFINDFEVKRREIFYETARMDKGVIYLGHLFDKWGKRKAIVDDCHFSPNFSRFLAEEVSQSIDLTKLRPTSSPVTPLYTKKK